MKIEHGRVKGMAFAPQNKQLLRDLSVISNAQQDIDDALAAFAASSEPKQLARTLSLIRRASTRIGKAVVRHLPG